MGDIIFLNMKKTINENLSPEIQKKASEIFKAIVASQSDTFLKKYGDEAEKVMFKTAIAKAKESLNKQEINENTSSNMQDLKNRIKDIILKIRTEKDHTDEAAVEYDELTKFPELKEAIVNLLTHEFNNFLSSIDWVSPKPSTFRINLKNNQNFYLIYGERSWIAQIEGKKYYITNLPEEQHACEALSRILRYGSKAEASEENDGFGDFETEDKPKEDKPKEEKPNEENNGSYY